MYYLPSNRTFWNYSGIALMLIVLFISMFAFSAAVGMIMSKYYNMEFGTFLDAVQGKMGYEYSIAARLYGFITFIGYMLFPSLLLLTINRTRLRNVLEFRIPGPKQIGISILLILAAIPVGMYLVFLIEGFSWPDALRAWANDLNRSRELQFNVILQMDSVKDLLLCLGLLALLPAFCEELFFRGIMQPILMHKTGKIWLSILLQALVFAVLHSSFYELFTIFGLGVLLGIIAYRYGILMSMLAHFIFNSTTIITEYLSQQGMQEARSLSESNTSFPVLIPAVGILIIIVILSKKIWVKH